jgi:hypothetical protein
LLAVVFVLPIFVFAQSNRNYFYEKISQNFTVNQDTTVDGYDDKSNSLLACSDGDRNAYLSFDYSTSAFIKYNSIDFTFSLMPERPTGEQWTVGIY